MYNTIHEHSTMEAVKTKNDKELTEMLTEKREEVRLFRFGTAGSAARDVRAPRKARRMVARILTEQRARRA